MSTQVGNARRPAGFGEESRVAFGCVETEVGSGEGAGRPQRGGGQGRGQSGSGLGGLPQLGLSEWGSEPHFSSLTAGRRITQRSWKLNFANIPGDCLIIGV